jgi:hypothetical protein
MREIQTNYSLEPTRGERKIIHRKTFKNPNDRNLEGLI